VISDIVWVILLDADHACVWQNCKDRLSVATYKGYVLEYKNGRSDNETWKGKSFEYMFADACGGD